MNKKYYNIDDDSVYNVNEDNKEEFELKNTSAKEINTETEEVVENPTPDSSNVVDESTTPNEIDLSQDTETKTEEKEIVTKKNNLANSLTSTNVVEDEEVDSLIGESNNGDIPTVPVQKTDELGNPIPGEFIDMPKTEYDEILNTFIKNFNEEDYFASLPSKWMLDLTKMNQNQAAWIINKMPGGIVAEAVGAKHRLAQEMVTLKLPNGEVVQIQVGHKMTPAEKNASVKKLQHATNIASEFANHPNIILADLLNQRTTGLLYSGWSDEDLESINLALNSAGLQIQAPSGLGTKYKILMNGEVVVDDLDANGVYKELFTRVSPNQIAQITNYAVSESENYKKEVALKINEKFPDALVLDKDGYPTGEIDYTKISSGSIISELHASGDVITHLKAYMEEEGMDEDDMNAILDHLNWEGDVGMDYYDGISMKKMTAEDVKKRRYDELIDIVLPQLTNPESKELLQSLIDRKVGWDDKIINAAKSNLISIDRAYVEEQLFKKDPDYMIIRAALDTQLYKTTRYDENGDPVYTTLPLEKKQLTIESQILDNEIKDFTKKQKVVIDQIAEEANNQQVFIELIGEGDNAYFRVDASNYIDTDSEETIKILNESSDNIKLLEKTLIDGDYDNKIKKLQEELNDIKTKAENLDTNDPNYRTHFEMMQNRFNQLNNQIQIIHQEGQTAYADYQTAITDHNTLYESFSKSREEKVKELNNYYQKKLNTYLNNNKSFTNRMNNSISDNKKKWSEWNVAYQNTNATNASINKEFDDMHVFLTDLQYAFESTWSSIGAAFGSESSRENLNAITADAQGLETMLTWQQAIEEGEKSGFVFRTLAQQSAPVAIAIGGSLVGIPPVVTAGIFGVSSFGQTKNELLNGQDMKNDAEEQLKLLMENKDTMDTEAFINQKINLEKTIAMNDLSQSEIILASFASGVIEFGFTWGCGTIPNASKVVNQWLGKGMGNNLGSLITRSNWKAGFDFAWQTGKAIGGESFEELGIYFSNEFAQGLITGRDMDFTQWDDVLVSSILIAGPMNGPTNLYTTITQQYSTSELRNEFKGIQDNLKILDGRLANLKPGKADQKYREQLHQEYRNELKKLHIMQSGLEIDAMLSGADGAKEMIQNAVNLSHLYKEANINPNDSEAVKSKKIEDHLATLSKQEASDFSGRLNTIENARQQILNETNRKLEGDITREGGPLETIFGEKGKAIYDRLVAKDPSFKELNNRDQLSAINLHLKNEFKNQMVNEAKNIDVFKQHVENTLYNGPFEKSKYKNRKRKQEDQMYETLARRFNTRKVQATSTYRGGKESLNLLQKSGDIKNLKVVEGKTEEELNTLLEGLNISKSEKTEIMQGLLDGSTKGMIFDGKMIVTGEKSAVEKELQAGNLLQGTVFAHEVGHLLDNTTMKRGELNNYASNLNQHLEGNDKLKMISGLAIDRLSNLKGSDGNTIWDLSKSFNEQSNLAKDEYIKSVQDVLMDPAYKPELEEARKAGPSMGNIFRGIVMGDFKLETSQDAMRYMTSFIDSFSEGKLSKEILRKQKAKIKAGDTTMQEGYKKSADRTEDVNALAEMGWDNKTWKEQGADFALETMMKEGMLDRLIASKLKVPMSVEATKDFTRKVYAELTSHAKRFNPEINDNFFGWLNSQIANKAGNVYNREYKVEQRTQDIDARTEEGAPVVQVAADTDIEMEFIDRIGLNEEQKEQYSQLRKDLGLNEDMMNKVRQAVIKTFGTKLPDVTSKQFRSELEKRFRTELKKPIQDLMGSRTDYDQFLTEKMPAIFKALPVETLIQMERNVDPENRIFTKSERITKPTEVDRLISEGRLPKDTNRLSGPQLHTKKKLPSDAKIMAFFRGTDMKKVLGYEVGGSTLGTRKDKLAMEIGVELAFDATSEVIQDPAVQEKRKGILELQGLDQLQNERAIIGKQINRDPSIKFSREGSTTSLPKNYTTELFNEHFDQLSNDIKKEGINALIDNKGKLIKDYPVDIPQFTVDVVSSIYNNGQADTDVEIKFKRDFFGDPNIPQKVKDEYKKSGVLNKKNIKALDKMHNDNKKLLKLLGPDIVNSIDSEFFGYHYRYLDAAATKKGKPGEKGRYSDPLMKLIDSLTNVKVDVESGVVPSDLNPMNIKISKSVFNEIINIQNMNIKASEKKALYLETLKNKVEGANVSNKVLSVHVAKTMIEAVRNGTISNASFLNLLQAQTSLAGGFRAYTDLSMIDFRDGSQALYISKTGNYTNNKNVLKSGGRVNVNHPQFKEVKKEFPDKTDREIINELRPKGEHLTPNGNTMLEIAKLAYDLNADIDSKLNEIFSGHSQLLTSFFVTDQIDKAYGKNSTLGYNRINAVPQDNKNFIGPNGESAIEILENKAYEKGLAKFSKETSKKADNILKSIDALKSRNQHVKNGEVKGMSTYDFDDTLAKTKSGVRARIPNTDGKPKPKRKVVFLAGGAGSGKGNVVSKLGLENMGFKIVNQDISLEWLKKNHGLPENMNDLTKEQRSILGKLGHQARQIAKGKMMKFKGKGDGVVVDGTGGSAKQMQKLVDEFKAKGYDVSMVFVETSLDVALDRNQKRKERSLLDVIVKRNHEAVQGNKDGFKSLFGERFMEVNTDNLTMDSPMPQELVNNMNNFVNSYEKVRLDAEQFAEQGSDILAKGGEFDFSEFNNVVDGTPGPLLDKAKERAKKFGTDHMYVLTARPQQSAQAIHEFLKSQGLNIPLKNITGLANSTGDAKAQWMLDKFAEGYNDMYFVDDAMQNVDAVKHVLEQLDVKSDVVQAKVKFSKDANTEFNEMIERTMGIGRHKKFSTAEARIRGKDKGKSIVDLFWVPPSAEDFKGLMYRFLGKGKQGDADMKWISDNLLKPFAEGTRAWNTYKQNMSNDYSALKKKMKDTVKTFKNIVPGTNFTVDTAVRVYLWNKNGIEIPGISKEAKKKLVNHVKSNNDLTTFADNLGKITKIKEGYTTPDENWMVGSIAGDLANTVNKIGRKQFLAEWIQNKNIVFSEENLNKIEAAEGPGFREALENILYRMETGSNRTTGIKDGPVNKMLNWINGSVGATMFFNIRSAVLQTMSTVNFMNWGDNNIFAASKAFANQPQFWKDFSFIFNSDMLKQRRSGLQIDVSASELTKAFSDGRGKPQAIINYLLEKGFAPTRIADSFAIAMGGASFYRNRFNKYVKEGMTETKAKEKAWLDFQEIAEETQQSSRPDMISQQQAGPLGRLVLAWQNTPMQMTRLTKKALSDIVNGRGDMKENISRVIYYGLVQNIMFGALQTGLMFLMFGDEDDEKIKEQELRVANGALDTLLRGTGIYGSAVATLKNVIIQWDAQSKKGYGKQDWSKVAIDAVSLSPPMGSKLRKVMNAVKTKEFNKGVGEELGLRIENPTLSIIANLAEATTNAPLARIVNKANNIEEALTGNHELWQRIALMSGWSQWSVGVEDEELVEAKERAKQKRAEEKKRIKTLEKLKKEQEEKDRKKREGIKTVKCSGVRSNGQPCSLTTETKADSWLCQYHKSYKPDEKTDTDNDGVKEVQCSAVKSNGKRCKNRTENKNGKCYAHQ